MDQQRLEYLHKGYLNGSLTDAEQAEWEAAVQEGEQEEQIKMLMEDTWHGILPKERITLSPSESDAFYNRIIGRAEPRRVRLWPRITVAASIALIIALGSVFYFNRHIKHNQEQMAQNDVNPGRQGATLTLANGTKIRLADAGNGQLASQSGVAIKKLSNGQLVYEIRSAGETHGDVILTNTLSTAKGETYEVKLPDGSLVWLNAASTLTYPANFEGQPYRRVKLEGEGYFEIAKDKAHAFIVESRGQEVEVLGTHFNVNAYTDEPGIATTLLEGAVRVTAGQKVQDIIPGQQAVNTDGQLKVTKANIETITDWKDGEFNLDNLDFRTAMRKIARWYDVEVIYDKSVPEDIEAGGWIPRERKLSSILKLIENSGQVKFRIEGKKVYVFK